MGASAALLRLGLVLGLTVVHAATTAPASLPQVDFSKMGTVGLGGSYDGLDFWTPDSGVQFSTLSDTLFSQGSDGRVMALGHADDGGTVRAVCWDGAQKLYVAGAFSSFNATSSPNIVQYDLQSGTFSALAEGLDGPVRALYCDGGNGQVWAGGQFTRPIGASDNDYKGGVAIWSTATSSWAPAPFQGLNGTVESISPSSNGSSVYFAGAFTTTFQSNTSSLFNTSLTTNSTNSTRFEAISAAPAGTTVSGLSGYLTPLSLNNATITASPASSRAGYNDATALLCPGGSDGSGNTWLARDGSEAKINVLAYKSLKATGIRLGNTFVEGRGTTSFRIISIPDNTLLTLSYTDPTTGAVNQTCSSSCPLSTDPSIKAQDFLFESGARDLTGYQVILSGWQGSGAGLNRLQLLSDGAYASASTSGNEGACASSSAGSSVETTGDWEPCTVPTEISGTTADVLYANIPVENPSYPSVTFYPYIASSGIYDVYLVTPGCNRLLDCAGRTSVDVEVFPTDGGLGWTSTISQKVDADTSSLIYSGFMEASSANFSSTIILALAAQPEQVDSGSNYVIVADQVLLSLKGVNGTLANGTVVGSSGNTSTITNSTRYTNASRSVAFGLYEWIRSTDGLDATSVNPGMSNATETALSVLGYSLDFAFNQSAPNIEPQSSGWTINTLVSFNDSIVYVAGNFSSRGNYSNVVGVDTTSRRIVTVDSEGLDGPVFAATRLGDYIYFGGNFTKPAQGDTPLKNMARYDPKAKAWAAVGGGVNGPITAIAASKTSPSQLIVVGNFTSVLSTNGTSSKTGGRAIWDTSSSDWVNSGLIFGSVSTVAVADNAMFLAGRVSGSTGNAANGYAMLSSEGGSASIKPLEGVAFGEQGSGSASSSSAAPSSTSSAGARRSLPSRNQRAPSHGWLSIVSDIISTRAGTLAARSFERRAPTPPTIPTPPAPAPAVLAGVYYQNTTASGKPNINILGGNFTTDDGFAAVAFYQDGQGFVGAPAGGAVKGVVRTMAVYEDSLFVGGTGLSIPDVASGLLICSLNSGTWTTGRTPALNAASGSQVVINAIRNRQDTSTIVVAGSFASAGSLSCPGICLWDHQHAQWTSLDSGLAGEVRAIDFAGSNHDILIAAGSFVINGDVAYVAEYSFTNNSWRALGDDLSGPATAVAVDDNNANNIFVTGISATDNSAYLAQWDGTRWNAQNSTLQTGSSVSQLAFVPMSNEHSAAGAIEKDRMLMVSGALSLASTGNVSTALYDGSQWYPYLVTSSESGSEGSAGGFFWSQQSFSFAVRRYLAKGIIVLIAIAIATGLVFLLVLLGILLAFCLRKRDDSNYPVAANAEKDDSSADHHVFHNVQTAVERSFAPAAAAGAVGAAHKRASDETEYTLGDQAMMAGDGEDDDYEGRETIMRYDFEGDDAQPGELTVNAGERIVVIDDVQSPEWSYVRVVRDGREGVVPSSYIW